jgi:hypothetical protein
MTQELIASWVTAIATVVLAIAAAIQLPLIARQVRALAEQMKLSRDSEANAERRMREWETLRTCQRYDFDPVLNDATRRIWIASRSGSDYRHADVDRRDIILLLNYLDGMAIGIEQGLYIDSMVQDHLGPMFDRAVRCFVESGIVDGTTLANLLAVHAGWFKRPRSTEYQSRSPSN